MLAAISRCLTYQDKLLWILQRPRQVIWAVLAVSVLFAWQIPHLSFSTSVYDLIIDDLAESNQYNAFKKIFGSDEIIRVVIRADDVFSPLTFRKIETLADAAAGIQGVRRIIGLPGIKKSIDVTGGWDMKQFAAVVTPVALFQRNLVSADRKTTLLTLVLENDADHGAVIAGVDRLMAQAPGDLSLYQIGMPLVSQALEQFTRKDFFRLPPVTFLLVALVLFFLFRHPAHLALPLACVSLALVWTFGLMAMTGIPLSMLTMIVPVFLIAVGTAYCLHILAEYRACCITSESPAKAVVATFSQVTFPTVLAVATTVIGLGSLLLNRIPAIREFALFACFGMVSLLVVVLTLFPAILVLIPLPEDPAGQRRPSPGWVDRFIEAIIHLNIHHQRKVIPLIVLLVIFCLIGIFRLRVETNPVGYFRDDAPVSRHFHDIYKDLSGSFPVNVTMTGTGEDYFFEDAGRLADMVRLQQFLETLPGVDKTISYADYLKLVNYASNRFEPASYRLPEAAWETRMLVNKFKMMLGEDLLNRFMSPDFRQANILMLTHMSSSRDFLRTRDQIQAHVKTEFDPQLKWAVTGFGIVISASSHLLTRGQVKSLSMTMVLVFGIMFMLFLSSKVGLVAIVPNLFPIVVNFGLMGWLGIELSMFTSLIASIAIGLAVDDTIHYLFRYNKEFREDLDEHRALRETLRHIGQPIIFTTITISIGFAILAFSSFKPTAIFGVMMMITLASALVGDLILLPSLMLHVELVTLWDLVRIKMGREPRYGIPIFQGMSKTQVHYIIMAGSLTEIEPGVVLFRKGEPSDSMYALISGGLDVVDHAPEQDPSADPSVGKLLARFHSGDVLGEMGLLRNAPRSATLIATQSCELLQINMKMIRRLQWLYPPTANKFFFNLMTILCDRLEKASTCLFENSLTDDVTGLRNRKRFMENLNQEAHRSRRYASDLSLCLLKVNPPRQPVRSRAEMAPTTLQSLSRALSGQLRRSDILGRLGICTFALLLPHTPDREAQTICDRLVQQIRVVLAENNGDRGRDDTRDGGVHVAMGLASLNGPEESGQALYARAEAALKGGATPEPCADF
jgi:uncharacterized protein